MFIDILENVPIKLGKVDILSTPSSRISMVGGHNLVHIPIVIGNFDPKLRKFINLYLISKASNGSKDLSSAAKAFQLWVRWLLAQSIDPFSFPKSKAESPTYGFRYFLLERVCEMKDLQSSTANSYILTIKNFYEMLEEESVVKMGIFFKSKTSIVDGYRKVQSSDLAIKVDNRRDDRLNPLSLDTQSKLQGLLAKTDSQFSLLLSLMIHSGLRLGEVLSLPGQIFDENSCPNNELEKIVKGIIIGPSSGVKTKFLIERELFLTVGMLDKAINYKLSNSYLKRLKKSVFSSDSKINVNPPPLFFTINGKPFSKSAFYSAWFRMKKDYLDLYGEVFIHKPHDLRATFATNIMTFAMQIEPNNQQACLDITRYYMGHKNESTTLKYIKFTHRKKMVNEVAVVMDRLIIQFLGE
ncbi:site-specific integrase [Shewanella donghaensis]|uniref:site-specific integrase n=1 Tax=Shewanella donghaensis TaxID=238836 RepID=UPI0011821FB7|nr:site-specific integrase [Shewanella donghaensis]